jgi:hypothetical protein
MRGDWDARQQGAERQRNNQPNEQTNGGTNKQAGAMWGDDVARRGDGGGRFSAPKAPHSSPLKHCHFGWLLCCFWLEDLSPPMGTPCRMTVIEMRWAKSMSMNDCLISSDVYGYLYFDFCWGIWNALLAVGRFLYGRFLYGKWLYLDSWFFQVKYVRVKMQFFVLSMDLLFSMVTIYKISP